MSDFSIGSKLIIKKGSYYELVTVIQEYPNQCGVHSNLYYPNQYNPDQGGFLCIAKHHKNVFLPTPELIQLAKNTKVRKLIGL